MKHEVYGSNQDRILQFISSNLTQNFQLSSPLVRRKRNAKIIKIVNETSRLKDVEDLKETKELKNEYKLTINKFKNFKYYFITRLLTASYFLIKILYLIVALSQIYVMNSFLSSNKHEFYGAKIVKTILSGDVDIRDHLGKKRFFFYSNN